MRLEDCTKFHSILSPGSQVENLAVYPVYKFDPKVHTLVNTNLLLIFFFFKNNLDFHSKKMIILVRFWKKVFKKVLF